MMARSVLRLAEVDAVEPRSVEVGCECNEQAVAEKRWPTSLGPTLGATNASPYPRTNKISHLNCLFETNCARENGHERRPRE
jgi:hypothetical protein